MLNWVIQKLSITMFNYLLNSGVLDKIDSKIGHYFFHQFSLRLPKFIGI
ncbi:hypothetical protein DFO77_102190 [Marinilabilia salmonicolor]|uniref:Uncharacterized protein n=1 Tax=Marinilabilia salmonicolor TaxID=989 RepID=A0A368VFM7_9BACT|nr:hypothetical protein DFO77_102190 [Marinilabilia salmonicolor]